jgi:hypothetical protein
LIGCGFEAAKILSAVEISGDLKSSLGLGAARIVEDLLVGIQRFACPVARNFGEEAMPDGIPFGSTGGIVGYGYGQAKGVGQLRLELGFPGIAAATVGAAGIGQNEQLAGTKVAGGTFLVPPMSDGMSGKGGSVLGNADHQSLAILCNIVNPVGDRHPDGIGAEVAEVVIIDNAGPVVGWRKQPTIPLVVNR